MKRALLVIAALALPSTATALPRTIPDFEIQMEICRVGLEMIVDGATDEEEVAMYQRRLKENGWSEPDDLDDLMLLCSFYKQGYLYALEG